MADQDIARSVAEKFLADVEKSERPAIFAVAAGMVGDERAEQRFGARVLIAICDLRNSQAPAPPDFLFDIQRKEK